MGNGLGGITVSNFPVPGVLPVEQAKRVLDVDSTIRIIRLLFSDIYALSGRGENGAQLYGPLNCGGNIVSNAKNSSNPSTGELLTYAFALSVFGAAVMQKALSALGSNPLNVQGLHGVLSDPQAAGIPDVSALTVPPILPDPVKDPPGPVVIFNNALWRFVASPAPGMWVQITTSGVSLSGLRSALPGTAVNGTTYFAQDYGWVYIGIGGVFQFGSGIAAKTEAQRAGTSVSAVDNGAVLVTTDLKQMWYVTGGAWTLIGTLT